MWSQLFYPFQSTIKMGVFVWLLLITPVTFCTVIFDVCGRFTLEFSFVSVYISILCYRFIAAILLNFVFRISVTGEPVSTMNFFGLALYVSLSPMWFIFLPWWAATFCIISQFTTFCAFVPSCGTFMLFGPVGCSTSVTIQSSGFGFRSVCSLFYFNLLFCTCRIFFSSSVPGDSFRFSFMYWCSTSLNAFTDNHFWEFSFLAHSLLLTLLEVIGILTPKIRLPL